MIRSTKHYISYANSEKKNLIKEFIFEYKFAVQKYIDYIWDNRFFDSHNNISFDISKDILNYLPKYIDCNLVEFETKLSARALRAAMNQANGIVKGATAIRRNLIYIIKKRKEKNLSTYYYENKLLKNKLSKPFLKDNFSAELCSNNIIFTKSTKYFEQFIKLYSTGFKVIYIPIKHHKQDRKFIKKKDCKLISSVLLSENCIQVRYKLPDIHKKQNGKKVGGDTGLNTILTLSDGQTTPKQDNHGHSLESICKELANKKKGSKSFAKKQQHRLNFINWSVNQLDLSNIKLIKLEEINKLFFNNKFNSYIARWAYADIEKQIIKIAEETGVQLNLQPSVFKSQRCSGCGIVLKSNRRNKEYFCKNCNLKIDADLNSAINNELELPKIPFEFRQKNLNKTGFFWKESGFTNLSGQELIVPDAEKKKLMICFNMNF